MQSCNTFFLRGFEAGTSKTSKSRFARHPELLLAGAGAPAKIRRHRTPGGGAVPGACSPGTSRTIPATVPRVRGHRSYKEQYDEHSRFLSSGCYVPDSVLGILHTTGSPSTPVREAQRTEMICPQSHGWGWK